MSATKTLSLTLCLLLAGSIAHADEMPFQRIRTFDPVRGLVPGNGTSSLMAPKLPPSAGPAMPSAAPDFQRPTKTNANPSVYTPADTDPDQESTAPETKDKPPTNGLLAPTRPAPTSFSTPASSNFSTPGNSGSSSPLAPPDAPRRPPLPPGDSAVNLPPVGDVKIKPSLSWRAKAYKLAMQPDGDSTDTRHPAQIMNGSVEDSLNALTQACQAKGAQMLGKSVPAGQLGARVGDATAGRYVIFFVAKKISDDRTLVKAGMDPDSRSSKATIMQELLTQAASIVDGKGMM